MDEQKTTRVHLHWFYTVLLLAMGIGGPGSIIMDRRNDKEDREDLRERMVRVEEVTKGQTEVLGKIADKVSSLSEIAPTIPIQMQELFRRLNKVETEIDQIKESK